MTTALATTTTPIQISIPPTLTPYTVSLTTFLSTHPAYTSILVTTYIFNPLHTHLLLLRRAATDSFPLKWEPPGGGIGATDPTLIHTAARETFEETGLRLMRVVRTVGEEGEEFVGRGERWLRVGFEIEVVEMEGCLDGRVEGIVVRVDPEEHEEFAWVTEEEVRDVRWDFTTDEVRGLVLRAFEAGRREGGG